ncbi:MAG: hypothetical protein LBJ46_10265 [Planctomycetota bacterium]|jgi:hypothetical protein|nr:hypothetical protein [Planctomycetota bacterium]
MTKKVKEAMNRQKARRGYLHAAVPGALSLFMMLLVVLPVAFGSYLLWRKALKDPQFHMKGDTLALAGGVRECPESIHDLQAIGKSFDGRSLLDPRLLSDIEKRYSESYWIKRITVMRRHFPNRIEIGFLIRRPAAQVWSGESYWLVDIEGRLLPVEGSRHPFEAVPEIIGATAGVIGKPPAVGAVWADEGVLGALGMMRSFWASPLAEQLPIERVIVVGGIYRDQGGGEVARRRRFEAVVADGAVVRWGTYNERDLEGELTTGEKLWQLHQLLLREEALTPGICFDVRTRLPGFTQLPHPAGWADDGLFR